MKTIKLWFSDFYTGFEPHDNFLYHLLSEFYQVELEEENPEYLIYSCYGNEFLKFDCIRIFYTGENIKPDFNLCDYAIGFDYMKFEDRYLRFPNFAFYGDQFDQLQVTEVPSEADVAAKSNFCNFIYSNAKSDPARDHFFHLLSDYKKVLSPGRHLNNSQDLVGGRRANDWMYSKIDFQSSCKFSIAFENASSPGYTTEKLVHAFISKTVPIYWGNPEVDKDFNPKAFINCHDYENFEEVIERVKELDQNDEMYLSVLKEPPFRNNIIPENLRMETLSRFLRTILDKEWAAASKRAAHGTVKQYEDEKKELLAIKERFRRLNKLVGLFGRK